MVVADGMGGMNAGDVASMLAISTGVKLADKSVKWGFKINEKEAKDLLDRLSAYFREIDRRITRKSESDRKLFGMGTTLTLAYSVGSHLFLIHVGDSRAYLYRRGHLQQLTRDHTVAQALADAGHIKQEDVRKHPKRNTLTNYLGGHRGKIKADVRWLRLEDGDRILALQRRPQRHGRGPGDRPVAGRPCGFRHGRPRPDAAGPRRTAARTTSRSWWRAMRSPTRWRQAAARARPPNSAAPRPRDDRGIPHRHERSFPRWSEEPVRGRRREFTMQIQDLEDSRCRLGSVNASGVSHPLCGLALPPASSRLNFRRSPVSRSSRSAGNGASTEMLSLVMGWTKPSRWAWRAWRRTWIGRLGAFAGAVELIAQDRVADLGQVDPDLVGPPGLQPAGQQARRLAEALQRPRSASRPPRPLGRAPGHPAAAVAPVGDQGQVDPAGGGQEDSLDDRQVDALDRMLAEHGLERPQGPRRP